ncbi:hypothetical protein BKP66_15660 [Bacillus amyloliquefaciens]|uniref:Uncharacterized protein n=1 Tax=Bacillus amyloliquefaciens TaxID=1390 RepID=A0AAP7N6E2_BACAM|nr:hypothetical protein BKP66_15660 [Bacillus amyloliquefaciens]
MQQGFLKRSKIPYDLVTKKLNAWYMAIKSGLVDEAERIKVEAEAELANMEENQDALLYYQLLEFRHEIMLSYMKSKNMFKRIYMITRMKMTSFSLIEFYVV